MGDVVLKRENTSSVIEINKTFVYLHFIILPFW